MAWGTIDDADFQKFTNQVKGKINGQALKHELEISARRVGTQGLRSVKAATPVGQYTDGRTGGTLRRGWNVKGPSYTGSTFVIELFNNVEYAGFVENGHRTRGGGGWVEGRFMLYKTIKLLNSQLPQLLSPALQKALGGLFD
ncbi:HK97 gp10 family phage protein [Agrilactobacillus fermenti]|uniref:HK97 gp10 family phage protein n=1 Tax=Agrilactobacillus fermenti TaxID=2586909 RepID=UPI003A5C0B23